MLGFMSTTAFLSMWISNTATTAMMIPIAHAVLTQLSQQRVSTTSPAEPDQNGPRTISDQLNMQSDARTDQIHTTGPHKHSHPVK